MAILTVYTKLLDKSLSVAHIIDMGNTRTAMQGSTAWIDAKEKTFASVFK